MLPYAQGFTAPATVLHSPAQATFSSFGYGYTGNPQAMNPTEFATLRANVTTLQGTVERLDERSKNAATSEQLTEARRSIEGQVAKALAEIKQAISPIESRLATIEERTRHLATRAWIAVSALLVTGAVIGACWALLRPLLEQALLRR